MYVLVKYWLSMVMPVVRIRILIITTVVRIRILIGTTVVRIGTTVVRIASVVCHTLGLGRNDQGHDSEMTQICHPKKERYPDRPNSSGIESESWCIVILVFNH